MEDRLREIDEENVIWIIYLGIIALSYYANYKEVKYLITNNQKEKEEFYGIQHLLQNENSKVKAYGS